MSGSIVLETGTVILVGGGDFLDEDLHSACQSASALVAADGGAERLTRLGYRPDAVIGDMDSLSPELKPLLAPETVQEVTEQDSTDFEKCLRRISAPEILGFGFLGARVDHTVAALTVLATRFRQSCILVGREDVVALAPPRLALDLPSGMRLSLWPLGPVAGRSAGLRWPIEGLDFAPAGTIGTSNEVTGPVALEFEAPLMVLILPKEALPELRRAMARSPRWEGGAEG